jgi:hypothetical protein
MTRTPATTTLLALAKEAGAVPYDMLAGSPETTKLARFRLKCGNPIAIQVNSKTPRLWMLAGHERGAFASLGNGHSYKANQGHHHHLDQIREFKGQPLLKIEISETNPSLLRAALAAVSASC